MTDPRVKIFKILKGMAAGGSVLVLLAAPLQAAGEITVKGIELNDLGEGQFDLTAWITNTTPRNREAVLRAQVVLFERNSPPGDVPAAILRKDPVLVLRPHEARQITVHFVGEGTFPMTALRTEAELRVQRQREWAYDWDPDERRKQTGAIY